VENSCDQTCCTGSESDSPHFFAIARIPGTPGGKEKEVNSEELAKIYRENWLKHREHSKEYAPRD
jgi:hypothetical protein